jgi:hypothetical protein
MKFSDFWNDFLLPFIDGFGSGIVLVAFILLLVKIIKGL